MSSRPQSAELHPGPGFRVRVNVPRVDPAVARGFAEMPTPDISDHLNRLYALTPEISCLTGAHHRLCNPACTVRVFPGDNLMVHKSLDVAKPGDVIVIAGGGGHANNAALGDILCTKAKHREIAGFIVDGLIRDLQGIQELDFPVFARGSTPIGPLHRGPGEINFPIACGGVVVHPGDLIVADAAGIVVVPRGIAAELLPRMQAHKASNAAYLAAVARGEFDNRWVDRVLQSSACQSIAGEQPLFGLRRSEQASRGDAS